ncbi:MAG: flagellar protein FlaG [Gammaproteobacteria bacterium]|nr:flagellar protein FlaG [Gammaproteobacteria bacterium]
MSNLDAIGSIHAVGNVSSSEYQDQRSRQQLTETAVKPSAESEKLAKDSTENEPDRAELEAYVSALNDIGEKKPPHLKFEIDDDTGHTVIKMIQRDNGELVRQIPSEEFMQIARMIKNNGETLNQHPGQWIELDV